MPEVIEQVVARYVIEGNYYIVRGCLGEGRPYYLLTDNDGKTLNLADPFQTLPSRDTVLNYISTQVQ
jgi:hypothetical protein